MKTSVFFFILVAWTGSIASLAQDKSPPVRVNLANKQGAVVYYHYLHVRRADNDCKVCHPATFQKDSSAPLNYRDHAAAESSHSSCAFCHYPGGRAFGSANNCDTACHAPKQ